MSGELYVNPAAIQTLVTFYRNMQTEFISDVNRKKPAVESQLQGALRGQASTSYMLMVEDFVRDFNTFINTEVEQLQMTLTQTADKITQVDAELGAIIGRMRG